MNAKHAKVGVRVAPKFLSTAPSGTIVEVVNDLFVMVAWDYWPPAAGPGIPGDTLKEQIKFLRKGDSV
jgi:hypothetical protein